jgi:hypothetical protein
MEVFIRNTSKVYIIENNGEIRFPFYSEVNFSKYEKTKDKIKFNGYITNEKITKCHCKDDEIILEKTKENILLIYKAYKASTDLYKTILSFATDRKYKLEAKFCENLSDLYYLDKIIELYNKNP